MEQLINFQDDLYYRITKARINYKKTAKDRITKEYVEGRLEAVEHLWFEFLAGHKELMRSQSTDVVKASSYIRNETYDKCDELFLEYKTELKTKLAQFSMPSVSTDSSRGLTGERSRANVKLPKVNIDSFSGKCYSEWTTFRDLFRSLIHNNDALDDVQKLLYLKGYLAGEAKQLLSSIPITQDNYARAWDLLEDRYNNKKYVSNQVLERLLGQRNVAQESASSLKEILDTTNDCLASLSNLGIKTENWDILVIHIVAKKLDPESRRQWEFSATDGGVSDELPTYTQFQEFLTKRYRALEFLDPRSNKASIYQGRNNIFVSKSKSMHITTGQCTYCSEKHTLADCVAFKRNAVEARRNFVQSNKICFCCLGPNHTAHNCKRNLKCSICSRRHHVLLHQESANDAVASTSHVSSAAESTPLDSNNDEAELAAQSSEEDVSVISCFARKHNPILLATALVRTESRNGQGFTVRALLDQGSQSSFITEAMVQQLGLKKTFTKIQITGIGGDKALVSNAVVNLKISSRFDPRVVIDVKAHVLKSITTLLPTSEVKTLEWKELQGIVLADPGYHTPNRIDMLLGAEVYAKILQDGVKKCPKGSPIAQCTSLGWILSGALDTTEGTSEIKVMHIVADNDFLKRFWELEDDVPMCKERLQTNEEKRCEEYFAATTVRDEEGRYIVRLPFKDENPVVDHSLKIAEKRLLALERRLKGSDLKQKYKEVINEYLQLKHMELIPMKEVDNPKAIYLPHHAVVREDKQTTKVRAVFDASCKGTNNKSLNDHLLTGPTLQADLRHLVIQWRVSRICLTADIEKMYRQIKVDETDVNYQRILWRDDPAEKIRHYRMLRVTFGVSSAPYLAVKTLQQLSVDEGQRYPSAAKAMVSQFYMDDLLAGCENVLEGMKLYREMNALAKKGGFKMRKWTSNSEELLQEIKQNEKEEAREEEAEGLKIKTDEVMKIVGLTWDRRNDSFRYEVDTPEVLEPATKRSIISEICRFYDPLGWAGPSIIVSKILIQRLWLAGLNWDEIVPDHILNEWKNYKEELKMLTHVTIPRWIGVTVGDLMELHGFSDASNDAYAAVVYARVIDSNGQIHVSLISAKTKVAPLKRVSIPRLELCGAVLLTRLMMEIASVMKIDKAHLHAWTDSTVVLAWLNSHPSRWKVFVANRVSEIVLNLESHHWFHVSTKCNPADAASRGQSPSNLAKNVMWFQGPEFLHKDCIDYIKPKEVDTNVEEINVRTHCATVDSSILERFSSLTRMVRVIAYCRRFVQNLKGKRIERQVGFLTTQELNDSMKYCIRQSQKERFSKEISIVRKGENLPRRSSVRTLNPFLDEDGLLRVGGRLEHSNLSIDRKHPVLMPKDTYLSNLLITDAHKQTLHGGPQLMLCYLRNKYWILGAARLVKQCFRKCVTCVKNTRKTETQLMGQLPMARSTPARAFKSSGVDFAGPIQIRTAKGRGHQSHKGYICLFVCMASRAVYLDVVTSLTTEGFLQAFKRFVSRRGYCTEIWSDNGTNFTGAASELRKLFKNEKGSMIQELSEALATNGCSWNFIPARSPHFGGLWEGGIKSVKYHLKRVIGQSTLTFEEMATVLAQIEACLNSRPLSVITGTEDTDATILTPGHFLIGEPLVIPPDQNFEDTNISSLRRWQYTQRMAQDFWRQWSRQYLTRFFKRYRWSSTMPQPRIGDIVVVREEALPPCRWLYGRVIDTHPGQDNLTRVVTLKVKNGTIKRAVGKLCLLPITDP